MPRLTTEQETACAFAGGSVLVSAAAGAGKTTTLSERVVRRCLDPADPVEIDRFLLVTFTEKAALEMRMRISADLGRRALAGDSRAQAQLERLPLAHISTIHGFCLRLIREEWQALGLDAEAALMDERQAEVLRRQALDSTLGAAYAERSSMARLVAYFGGMGEDDGLREAVLKALKFLDTVPDPEGFLSDAAQRHMRDDELQSALRRVMAENVRQVEEAASLLRQAAAAARELEGQNAYVEALEGEATQREAAVLSTGLGWDQHRHLLQDAALFAPLRGNSAPGRETAHRLREKAKRVLARLSGGIASLDEAEVQRRTRATDPILADFLALLRGAMDDYRRLKRQRGVLDFADLEQEAYRLLTAGDSTIGEGVRRRFREVLVDEFQDVNPLQAAIVDHVSRLGKGGNLFAVGDVKQSIYGFRHAAPGIFLEREREAAERRAALGLRQNFRSRAEIVDVVNAVFRALMQEEASPLYDARAELVAGRDPDTVPPDPDPRVRFVEVRGVESDEEGDEQPALVQEATWIAAEIARLMAAEHPVWDAAAEKVRPVRYGDCAVLLRGLQSAAAVFDDVFALRGIPAMIQRSQGYLGGQELQTLLSLLRTIELPERDWDLLVTLRAPWFDLSLADAVSLRQAAAGAPLFDGLRSLGQSDGRMRTILDRIELWRQWSLTMPLDRLVERLLQDTEYGAHVAGLPRGAQRRRDILAFQEAAERLARQGPASIGAFLAVFEELSRQHLDVAPPDVDMGDAVRVTTIHRSKGLEFPVVFVAGLGRRLGGKQERDRIRLHRSLGVAAAFPDDAGGLHPTPFWRAIEAEERQEALYEEIRLLYVAMTRARDRLYLTATGEAPAYGGAVSPARIRAATRPVEWLAAPLLAEGLPIVRMVETAGEKGDVERGVEAATFDDREAASAFAALPDRRAEEPGTPPLRLSASSLAEAEQGYGALLRLRRRQRGARSPEAARAAGVYTHRLLECIDLMNPPADLAAALDDLIGRGLMPKAAAGVVDLAAVGRFLASPTAARIRGAHRLERELAFSVLADASGRPETDGRTVLQGKIDLLLEDDEGWMIVDFKTDHVTRARVPEAAQAYRAQVEAYRQALRAIAGVEAQAVLYFLAPGVAVPMA